MTWSKVSFTWHPLRHLSLTITPLAYKSHLRTPVPQHAPCKWLVPILDRMFKFMLVPVQCACSCRIWVAPSYSCQHRSKSLNRASRNGVSFFRILTPHRSVSLWSFKYFINSWVRWKNMFFSSLKFGKFVFLNKFLKITYSHFGPMKKYQVIKSSKTLKKKIILKMF